MKSQSPELDDLVLNWLNVSDQKNSNRETPLVLNPSEDWLSESHQGHMYTTHDKKICILLRLRARRSLIYKIPRKTSSSTNSS